MSVEIQSLICGYLVTRFITRSPSGELQHGETEGRENVFKVSLVQTNNNKVSKFTTSNCTEENSDWTFGRTREQLSVYHILAFHRGIWFIFEARASHARVLKPGIKMKDFRSQTRSAVI